MRTKCNQAWNFHRFSSASCLFLKTLLCPRFALVVYTWMDFLLSKTFASKGFIRPRKGGFYAILSYDDVYSRNSQISRVLKKRFEKYFISRVSLMNFWFISIFILLLHAWGAFTYCVTVLGDGYPSHLRCFVKKFFYLWHSVTRHHVLSHCVTPTTGVSKTAGTKSVT